MKKLKITLNDKIYFVDVEVLEDDEQGFVPTQIVSQKPQQGTPLKPKSEMVSPSKKPLKANSDVVDAPINGVIVEILAKAGDSVKQGQTLVVLEAMKMKTNINAPQAATVKSVEIQVGEHVELGQVLMTFE